MKHTIEIPTLQDLPEAARQFVGLMDDYTVFTFNGPMGVGKTTFISALSQALGVDPEDEAVSSPSFSIVNEYRSATTAELIYHFDLYRLEDLEQALDLGIEDYLDCGAVCLLEWPTLVEDILPSDTVRVDIAEVPDGRRILTVTTPD